MRNISSIEWLHRCCRGSKRDGMKWGWDDLMLDGGAMKYCFLLLHGVLPAFIWNSKWHAWIEEPEMSQKAS